MNVFGLTNIFDLFPCTLYVGDHSGDVPLVVVVLVVVIVVGKDAGVLVLLAGLVVAVALVLQLVYCLIWELACLESPPDVQKFLV